MRPPPLLRLFQAGRTWDSCRPRRPCTTEVGGRPIQGFLSEAEDCPREVGLDPAIP